jgi:DNA invertase Pin-like site-specific DNA recombinase
MPVTGMTTRGKNARQGLKMPPVRTRMILYTRVSTDEQHNGIPAQMADLERAAEYSSWRIVEAIADKGASGKDLNRPGLRRALELIAGGDADGLAVAKLDRLSRSVVDAGAIAEWFEAAGARLVALDLNVDTSTPTGRMMLNLMATLGQWERETIGQRTRDALAAVRAAGKPTGRPAVADSPELADRILELRAAGDTFQAIADELNADGIPTLRGGRCWRPSSVQSAAGYVRARPRHKPADLPVLPRRG